MMNSKIHVLHVVLDLQPGGLENGVVNVANRLPTDRFNSTICCLKQRGEFATRLKPGIPVHEIGWQGGNNVLLPFRLAKLFRQIRPHIVHTRNAESYYYGFLGAKLAGIDCIIHSEHGRSFDDRAIRFRLQRWLSTQTQAVFTVSRQLKRDLAFHTRIPEQSIQVIQNGVDLNQFKSVPRDLARHALGLQDGDVVLGSVGRMVAVKNYALLLRAIAGLGRPDVMTVLVGSGPEKEALENLSKLLGIDRRVRFYGHRDDVHSFLSAMDVFVLPSISEGMSNTLLEAMASGVPGVASNVGGNGEIVIHGTNGFLFESGDEAALTGYLKRLCADRKLCKTFGDAARTRIACDFSLESMIARYQNLYEATLSSVTGRLP